MSGKDDLIGRAELGVSGLRIARVLKEAASQDEQLRNTEATGRDIFKRLTYKEGGDQTLASILKVTECLDNAGIQKLPLNDADLYEDSRIGELFLAWREKGKSLQIFCGGRIGEDFVQRKNNVYMVLVISNSALGKEVIEVIKTDPNKTLEQIMYRIFRSSSGEIK